MQNENKQIILKMVLFGEKDNCDIILNNVFTLVNANKNSILFLIKSTRLKYLKPAVYLTNFKKKGH